MAVLIVYAGTTGQDYKATLQKITDTGTLGNFWNVSSGAFAAATWDQAKIDINEVTTPPSLQSNLGSYVGATPKLGNYTGWLVLRINDEDDVNKGTIYATKIYVVNGREVKPTSFSSIVEVSPARTWRMTKDSEQASNIINLNNTDNLTLAMDFTDVLNPGATIASVDAVTEETANSITLTADGTNNDKRKAHIIVDALTANTQSTIRIEVTTTDGDDLSGIGNLYVE